MTLSSVQRCRLTSLVVFTSIFIVLARLAHAQSTGSIAGGVTDTTGGVLPGVTVEAASPTAIEKIRTAVTDGQGRYLIEGLRPGTYAVTFTLSGFRTVRREGIQLTTGFTANVSVEMSVGALDEAITVLGASPVVDVQNVRTQNVLSRETLDTLPASRSYQSLAALTLGARFASAADQDVGGSRGEQGGSGAFTVHNTRANDARMTLDGMLFSQFIGESAASNRGQFVNQLAVQETTIETSGMNAAQATGGAWTNVVPKDGSNTFTYTFATNGTNSSLQSSNLDDNLRARGVLTSPEVKKIYDIGGSVGGRVVRDRIWFFTAHRWWGTQNIAPAIYFNSTQHTLFYTPDLSRPAYTDFPHRDSTVRVTWQVSPKNKVSVTEIVQRSCSCFTRVETGQFSPEATYNVVYYPQSLTQATWSYPASNRLLFEAGGTVLWQNQDNDRHSGVLADDIPVTELSTNFTYNAHAPLTRTLGTSSYSGVVGSRSHQANQRFSMAYVTGSHSFKTGMSLMEGWGHARQELNNTLYGPVSFQFRNQRPVSLAQYPSPTQVKYRLAPDLGIYAQDQWTIKRLTLNLGVRYDFVRQYAPAVSLPGSAFVGPRDFPQVDNIPRFHDVSPRLGAAYDLFGDGRTALKGSVNRYVSSQMASLSLANAPASRIALGATRTWDDADGNFVPDCDLTNSSANGECGRLSNVNLGLPIPSTTYSDDVLRGWGIRPYTWEATLSVQRQLWTGAALNVGYFYTSHGGFTVTENRALAPGDFDEYCITAPTDARLGSASGRTLCGLYDVTPTKFGRVDAFVQPATTFGEQSERYHGVEIAVNAQLPHGGLISGGVSTGRTVNDRCDVVQGNPQIGLTVGGGQASLSSTDFCREVLPWSGQTQLKLFGHHPLWWGLQASATYQYLAGVPLLATYLATNDEIVASLGRNLSSCPSQTGACTGTVSVALMTPNTEYEDRLNQVDFRLTKMIALGKARLRAMVDMYNVFNANTVLAATPAYGSTWLRPTAILTGRLFKFGAQVDF